MQERNITAMINIAGKTYYTTEEAARFAGVSIRTLRRWISAGQLTDFLYPFRASPSEVLYRMEPPEETDRKNEKGEWILPREGGTPHENSGA